MQAGSFWLGLLVGAAAALFARGVAAQSQPAYLILGSESAVYQRDDSGETLFLFPAGTRLRLEFGSADASSIRFTVPVDGLEGGGSLDAEGKRSLGVRLLEPAAGSIRFSAPGELQVELAASIAVSDAATRESWNHLVRLTTEKPESPIASEETLDGKRLDPASGGLELVAAGIVRTREGKVVGTYHSLVAGRIEGLPSAARSLRAP